MAYAKARLPISKAKCRAVTLWLKVANADEEISACRSLLATSSGLVGSRLDNEAAATGNRPRRAAPNRVTHGAVNALHIRYDP